MEILQAILLGVIEGLTEFLPVSSTGHLLLAQEYVNFKDTAYVFTVVVQSGAISAVIWHYRHDLWRRVKSLFKRERAGVNFFIIMALGTIPAGLAGLALENHTDAYAVPLVIAVALIAGAFVLLAIDRRPAGKSETLELDDIKPKQALLIGLGQSIALIPGVSRSGASIVGGLLTGLNRVTATAFSFYLAIPVILIASTYKLAKNYDQLGSISGGTGSIIAGFIAAFIVALIAIKWLLKYVSKHNFRIFAYYRIALGILILLVLA